MKQIAANKNDVLVERNIREIERGHKCQENLYLVIPEVSPRPRDIGRSVLSQNRHWRPTHAPYISPAKLVTRSFA